MTDLRTVSRLGLWVELGASAKTDGHLSRKLVKPVGAPGHISISRLQGSRHMLRPSCIKATAVQLLSKLSRWFAHGSLFPALLSESRTEPYCFGRGPRRNLVLENPE